DFDQPARQFLREANSIQAAVWIVARLAEGLEHAHSRGLLHRDLKPSHVLIASDGTPMLLDFNLSTPNRVDDPADADGRCPGARCRPCRPSTSTRSTPKAPPRPRRSTSGPTCTPWG